MLSHVLSPQMWFFFSVHRINKKWMNTKRINFNSSFIIYILDLQAHVSCAFLLALNRHAVLRILMFYIQCNRFFFHRPQRSARFKVLWVAFRLDSQKYVCVTAHVTTRRGWTTVLGSRTQAGRSRSRAGAWFFELR